MPTYVSSANSLEGRGDCSAARLHEPLALENGRQGTGCEKMLLVTAKWPLPYDCYFLRYGPGSSIGWHTDPVDGRRHYRLNVELRRADGGVFHRRAGVEARPRDPVSTRPRSPASRASHAWYALRLVDRMDPTVGPDLQWHLTSISSKIGEAGEFGDPILVGNSTHQ